MPKTLHITTHDGSFHTLEVADDYKFPYMDDNWPDFVGADGTCLAIHSKNIRSVLLTDPSSHAHAFVDVDVRGDDEFGT